MPEVTVPSSPHLTVGTLPLAVIPELDVKADRLRPMPQMMQVLDGAGPDLKRDALGHLPVASRRIGRTERASAPDG